MSEFYYLMMKNLLNDSEKVANTTVCKKVDYTNNDRVFRSMTLFKLNTKTTFE